MESSQMFGGASVPESTTARAWQAGHDVQFYDDDAVLVSNVAAFLAEGILSAQPVVVIATEAHVRDFKAELRRRGIDPDALPAKDIVWLDARDTLSAFMEGGRPSLDLFEATVGNVLERLIDSRRYVTLRAYGEMVDMLWRDGKTEAALELEELWNTLARKYSFALLCAYSKQSVNPGDTQGIERICALHTRVLPARPRA